MSFSGKILRGLGTLFVLALACAGSARASATLLLEEPYGKLGFFTATGHAAVYLSGVCAETPLTYERVRQESWAPSSAAMTELGATIGWQFR